MNLRQIYTTTPTERLEILTVMLQRIDARQHRRIFVRGWLIRERRDSFQGAHFLNDRRSHRPLRSIYQVCFIGILIIMTLTPGWLSCTPVLSSAHRFCWRTWLSCPQSC